LQNKTRATLATTYLTRQNTKKRKKHNQATTITLSKSDRALRENLCQQQLQTKIKHFSFLFDLPSCSGPLPVFSLLYSSTSSSPSSGPPVFSSALTNNKTKQEHKQDKAQNKNIHNSLNVNILDDAVRVFRAQVQRVGMLI
jgi:hypothetical protein